MLTSSGDVVHRVCTHLVVGGNYMAHSIALNEEKAYNIGEAEDTGQLKL